MVGNMMMGMWWGNRASKYATRKPECKLDGRADEEKSWQEWWKEEDGGPRTSHRDELGANSPFAF